MVMRVDRRVWGVCVSLGWASAASAGGGVFWSPAGGAGDLADGANWGGGVVPGAVDTAVFDTPGGSTTANLTLPTLSLSGISVISGDTTFDLGGRTISAGSLELGVTGSAAELLLLNALVDVSSLTAGDGVGSDVGLTVQTSGVLTVSGTLSMMSDAVLSIDGGFVTVDSLSLANAIYLQSGTLLVNDDLDWSDLGSPASLTLEATQTLISAGQLTLDIGDQLTLDGGSLSVQSLVGTGTLDYVSGSLSVATGIDIGVDKDFTSSVTLQAGDSWHSDGTISIDAGFGLALDGGLIGGDTVGVRAGAVFTMSSGSATLETLGNDGSVVINGGTLTLMRYNSSPGASLAINGPAFIRLTQQDLRLEPGADWGDALTLADDSTLQVYNQTLIGTTGPATLTLGAGAAFQTTELVLGDQAAINLDPTASLQANTVTNEDTLSVEDYLVYGLQPWNAPIVTLNNRGTLTYNTPGTAVVPAHLTGNGTLHVMGGTLVLDRSSSVETETLNSNTLLIDAGAELVLRDDRTIPGSFNIDRLTFSTGASPSLANDGQLSLDHISVQLLSPYTGSGAVHLSAMSQVIINPSAGPVLFHDLTAESSSTFYRSDFENGTIELTVLRSSGLSTFFDGPINVTFVEDVTVSGDGIGVVGDLTNLGTLRLADGAEVAGQSFGPTNSNRLNAPGATILLGDGSRFAPEGSFQNFGTVAVQGTGTGTVGVSSLTGNGVFDAGDGRLEVYVNTAGTWSGQFLGAAGSETLINVNNSMLTLSSAGLIDTDGDLTFESGGAATVIDAPLHVGGMLTLADNMIEVTNAGTAFDVNDLAIGDGTTLHVTSAQTIEVDSLTVLDSNASNPGSVTIDTAGQFNIGPAGITGGQSLTFRGGGTMHVAGDIESLRYILVDGSRFELAGALTHGPGEDIGLDNGGAFVVLAGAAVNGIDIDGELGGEALINYGVITVDNGEEWRDLDIENHGTIRILDGEGLNTRNASSFLLTGDLIAEQNTYLQFRGLVQSAAGDFEAAGTVRLLETNQFGGRVDLTGGLLEMISATLVFDATADVVTLGDVYVASSNYFDGQTGSAIVVDNLDLNGAIRTHLPSNDPIYVRGTLTSGDNRLIIPAVTVAGTVAPGRSQNDNYNRLEFRDDLTLQAGATVELELRTLTALDELEVDGAMTIQDGVALDLFTDSFNPTSFTPGDTVRLITTAASIVGAFDAVSGLAFGDGLLWRLGYDAAGLLAEVRLAGDLDGDGFVGVADLDVLLAAWGDSTVAGTGADLSGDGLVGQQDLALVNANWGSGTPAGPDVPEPGTLAMLGLGGLLIARRRR